MRIATSDLFESGYLHCCGAELTDLFLDDANPRTTVVFAFEGDNLDKLQRDYHEGCALVNLADYRRSFLKLKSMMFDLVDSARNAGSPRTRATTRNRRNAPNANPHQARIP